MVTFAPLSNLAWADDGNGIQLSVSVENAPLIEEQGIAEQEDIVFAASDGVPDTGADAPDAADSEPGLGGGVPAAGANAEDAAGLGAAAVDDGGTPGPSEAASPEQGGPADGLYAIRSALSDRSVLDVANGSGASGANVQLYTYNGTKAQQWRLSTDPETGLCTLANLISGMALDVLGASTEPGANVQVYRPNGTAAQQWRVVADGLGWRLEPASGGGLALDVDCASTRDGANVQAWTANGTDAQLFYLVPLDGNVAASTADVAAGAYVVRSAASGKVLDISGASLDDYGNAQQYSANSTYAQRFYFEPDGNGYYRVYNVGSGLALDVNGADPLPCANVQQYSANGTLAQLWSVQANSDGTVTMLSCAGGGALDVKWASGVDGANVQVYQSNGTAAQRFVLEPVGLVSAGGAVSLRPALAPSCAVDVESASLAAGASLQVYAHNGTAAQRFSVSEAAGGGIVLRPVCSGLCVGASPSGSAVQSQDPVAWTLSFSTSGSRRGVVLTAAGEGLVLTAASSSWPAPLALAAFRGDASQAFLPQPASDEYIYMDSTIRNTFSGIGLQGAKAIGVDVSVWNGDINWQRVAASGVSFAIVRCGYGSDYSSQDDKKYFENIRGAISAGLDVGVYLYSYATNTSMAMSEAAHTLRLLNAAGLAPDDLKYGVYYDVEDESQMSILLEPICNTYCSIIKNAGYSVGIYSSLSWWNGRLSAQSLNEWNRWVAQWPLKTGNRTCDYSGRYEMWQCMSDGVVPGIVGNVDMDIVY